MIRAAPFIAAFGLWLSGCESCPEPQYEGRASDEAWRTLVDAEGRATADAARAPALSFTDGTVFPASPVPTFTWQSSLSASSTPRARPAPVPRPAWHRLRGLFISEAWAHLPPVTGPIYWLKFAVPGQKCPVELLSTRLEWTATDAIWAQLGRGSGPRSVTAYSAYLNENRITEGPYRAPAAVTFTVSP
jgi:hypothetical protein